MTIDQVRHAVLLDLLEQALDDADIRLTASAKVRLRFTVCDLADAGHVDVVARQPPAVLDLDDVDRRIDHEWDRED